MNPTDSDPHLARSIWSLLMYVNTASSGYHTSTGDRSPRQDGHVMSGINNKGIYLSLVGPVNDPRAVSGGGPTTTYSVLVRILVARTENMHSRLGPPVWKAWCLLPWSKTKIAPQRGGVVKLGGDPYQGNGRQDSGLAAILASLPVFQVRRRCGWITDPQARFVRPPVGHFLGLCLPCPSLSCASA